MSPKESKEKESKRKNNEEKKDKKNFEHNEMLKRMHELCRASLPCRLKVLLCLHVLFQVVCFLSFGALLVLSVLPRPGHSFHFTKHIKGLFSGVVGIGICGFLLGLAIREYEVACKVKTNKLPGQKNKHFTTKELQKMDVQAEKDYNETKMNCCCVPIYSAGYASCKQNGMDMVIEMDILLDQSEKVRKKRKHYDDSSSPVAAFLGTVYGAVGAGLGAAGAQVAIVTDFSTEILNKCAEIIVYVLVFIQLIICIFLGSGMGNSKKSHFEKISESHDESSSGTFIMNNITPLRIIACVVVCLLTIVYAILRKHIIKLLTYEEAILRDYIVPELHKSLAVVQARSLERSARGHARDIEKGLDHGFEGMNKACQDIMSEDEKEEGGSKKKHHGEKHNKGGIGVGQLMNDIMGGEEEDIVKGKKKHQGEQHHGEHQGEQHQGEHQDREMEDDDVKGEKKHHGEPQKHEKDKESKLKE